MDTHQMNQSHLRVMLVDDHGVVRAGIRRLLEQEPHIEVVAEADSGEKAYQLFGQHLPDITVMDISMPGMGGLESIKRIVTRYPTAKILVLSMHDNVNFAGQALKIGARGYLSKSGLSEELIDAIQWIATGQTFLGHEISSKINFSVSNDDNPLQQLSVREFEIFRMLVDGVEVAQIAQRLNISLKTVANYQTTIKQKLKVNTPIEMVRLAIRHGLINE
jgi:two-component system, NarL family, invasion response regulator UvrY